MEVFNGIIIFYILVRFFLFMVKRERLFFLMINIIFFILSLLRFVRRGSSRIRLLFKMLMKLVRGFGVCFFYGWFGIFLVGRFILFSRLEIDIVYSDVLFFLGVVELIIINCCLFDGVWIVRILFLL